MSYSHLTLSERHCLYELRMIDKHSLSSIAQRMGRCKSTLSRELKRNQVKGQTKHQLPGNSCAKKTLYLPDTAEQIAAVRRQEAKTAFAKVSESCVREVKRRLALYHSPEQIAGRLKREGKEWDCLTFVDTSRLGYDANEECVQMPPTRPAYPPEFRVEAVRLCRASDRSLKAVAADLGISTNTLREWVRRAEMDEATHEKRGEDETVELKRLRREVRVLREEREILRKAAAFFAKEIDR